jgi:hypothetical protein
MGKIFLYRFAREDFRDRFLPEAYLAPFGRSSG